VRVGKLFDLLHIRPLVNVCPPLHVFLYYYICLFFSIFQVLNSNTRTGSKEIIIFLTDGKPEGGFSYTTCLDHGPAWDADQAGYVIYSIGLGDDIVESVLTDMVRLIQLYGQTKVAFL